MHITDVHESCTVHIILTCHHGTAIMAVPCASLTVSDGQIHMAHGCRAQLDVPLQSDGFTRVKLGRRMARLAI